MKSKRSDNELLEDARQAVERVISQLRRRGSELKSKKELAEGSELLEQALAATENVRAAIEGALGGPEDHPRTRNQS